MSFRLWLDGDSEAGCVDLGPLVPTLRAMQEWASVMPEASLDDEESWGAFFWLPNADDQDLPPEYVDLLREQVPRYVSEYGTRLGPEALAVLMDVADGLRALQERHFDPDQPRDDLGRFSTGSSGADASTISAWIEGQDDYQLLRDPSTNEGKNFTEVLSRLPIYRGTVYRGAMLTKEEAGAFAKGAVVSMAKHSSSSTEKDTALDFVGSMRKGASERVLFEVLTSTGRSLPTPAEPWLDQGEVVLPAGTRYHVRGRNKFTFEGHEYLRVYLVQA